MDETTSLLLSVCALLVVVGGLVVIGGFLALRFLRGLPRGALGIISNALAPESSEETDAPAPSRSHRVNVHDLAANVDFDAAVARQNNDSPPADISAQQLQPGQRPPASGTIGPDRVLRSGHDQPASPPAPRPPAKLGPSEGFQRVGGDDTSSNADPGAFPEPPLRRRRRSRDGDYDEDEVFGGLLDEDGDGDLDF